MEKRQRNELQLLLSETLDFLEQTQDFPRLSSRYIVNSVTNGEMAFLRELPYQFYQRICHVCDCISPCTDKLTVCYFVVFKIGAYEIYKRFSNVMRKIFEYLNLLFPYSLDSLYDYLAYSSPFSQELCKMLDTSELPRFSDLGMYEITHDFATILHQKSNKDTLYYLYGACLYLDRIFISPAQYEMLEPYGLFKTLRFLRIAGLSNAIYYYNKAHAGVVETAKALDVDIRYLLRYNDALERVFGPEKSFIELLVNNSRKKLVLKYNHYGIYIHLEQIDNAAASLRYMLGNGNNAFSAFIRAAERVMQPCRCYYLRSMCSVCPVCFLKHFYAEFRIHITDDRFAGLVRLAGALAQKYRLLCCETLQDARECIKSLQIMYNKRDFAFYVLSLYEPRETDFLSKTSDECLALLQSGYYDRGSLLPSCDAQTIRLVHYIYAASWTYLFNYYDIYKTEQSLSYFLQQTQDASIISHPSTERFMVHTYE